MFLGCVLNMSRGDKGFCSVECRSKQMVIDEDESFRRENCSFMAVKATKPDSPAPTSSGGSPPWSEKLSQAVFEKALQTEKCDLTFPPFGLIFVVLFYEM